ncbi:capsular polysaccharide transport system ATP-binding protein [Pseudomonas sp. ok272]|uniref:ABC transporter ATP-binding protein n=1 Tax=unclassified Pseudomonas TaxID=196821 RepID=UPI0008AC5BFE|nr:MULTISPECIES: ABC transporter ATP-binding protein [unclassified Pseudomonas]SEM99437.1 capsular polysaccharide transport system ATP-binding protein [Pseudomonas sp. ok272]SFM89744.1 capsular polysaccharide transport system ATP-binding protein [Pseudomonas sp. ok602]
MFELRNITKSYLTPKGRRHVFRDLSLKIPAGKNIGLIGRNGAGKSTLMRLLGGADVPDSGTIVTDQSISWPVGLSGGFQGSMSGRENIKFVSRVYGATGEAMRQKIAYVEDFAEIGSWIDEPVKTYSSGMRSRLAFGLSMAFDFDYYLIDEVMSVGDAHFKRKCAEVFQQRLQKSKVVLVSHSMPEIKKLCDVVLLVCDGGVQIYDDVDEGIKAYNT